MKTFKVGSNRLKASSLKRGWTWTGILSWLNISRDSNVEEVEEGEKVWESVGEWDGGDKGVVTMEGLTGVVAAEAEDGG